MNEKQQKVEEFFEEHELKGTTPFRLMDLVAEIGEIVADATKSAEYGMAPDKLKVKEDEIGDAFFSLFAVCNDLEIDAEEALETALEKYEDRIVEKGEPGSK